jgi:hypothetical protein
MNLSWNAPEENSLDSRTTAYLQIAERQDLVSGRLS